MKTCHLSLYSFAVSTGPHKIQTVSGVIRLIEDRASGLCSEITELSKLEKNAITSFENHEVQIDAEIASVEQNRTEMVSL